MGQIPMTNLVLDSPCRHKKAKAIELILIKCAEADEKAGLTSCYFYAKPPMQDQGRCKTIRVRFDLA
jgi:hypothetical protein